jgi:hypothetical protein
MRGREGLDEIGAQRARTRQRGRLVLPDHPRVADDIGYQNTSQTAVSLIHVYRSW